jgi:hypothetical protein
VPIPGFEQGGTVLLDFNALARLEGELQEKLEEMGTAALKSPRTMITVFAAALEEYHGAVDERTVGKIIHALTPDVAAELVERSFALAFPEAAEAGAGDPPGGAKTAPGKSASASTSGSKSGKTPKRSGGKPRARSRK